MKARMVIGTSVALLASLALTRSVMTAPAREAIPRTLTFCMGAENLPMSQEEPQSGIEVELARALAAKLGAEARFRWVRPEPGTFEQALMNRECDAVFGAILDPGSRRPGIPGLTLTAPYYSAGYALIRHARAHPVHGLGELRDVRIAVERKAMGNFTLRQHGNKVHLYNSDEEVVNAVGRGEEAYGYLWAPVAGWLLRDRKDVEIVREFKPLEQWSFAVAVREEDNALRRALDAAIRALIEEGDMARIFAAYGCAYVRPVEKTASRP